MNKHAVYKEKVDKEFVKQLDYNLIEQRITLYT